MANFKLDIKGLDKIQSKYNKLPKELKEEITEEIVAWGREVNAAQLSLISQQKIQDLGALQQNTKANPIKDGVELISNVYYAPFVEFGTGPQVKVPAELNEYAAQFRGKSRGGFRDFVKALQAWIKRKGGNPKMAYIAAINILNRGLKARPYFFPPYFQKKDNLIKNIQNVIKKL